MPVFSIQEHVCEGLTIRGDEKGNPVVSMPGEWGCEGLEQFYGDDGKIYYSYDDAEKSIHRYLGIENLKICGKTE